MSNNVAIAWNHNKDIRNLAIFLYISISISCLPCCLDVTDLHLLSFLVFRVGPLYANDNVYSFSFHGEFSISRRFLEAGTNPYIG